MASLRSLIMRLGIERVAADLGLSDVYVRHILNGKRKAGERVLKLAIGVYGKKFSVERTLNENALVPKQRPARPATDTSPSVTDAA